MNDVASGVNLHSMTKDELLSYALAGQRERQGLSASVVALLDALRESTTCDECVHFQRRRCALSDQWTMAHYTCGAGQTQEQVALIVEQGGFKSRTAQNLPEVSRQVIERYDSLESLHRTAVRAVERVDELMEAMTAARAPVAYVNTLVGIRDSLKSSAARVTSEHARSEDSARIDPLDDLRARLAEVERERDDGRSLVATLLDIAETLEMHRIENNGCFVQIPEGEYVQLRYAVNEALDKDGGQ